MNNNSKGLAAFMQAERGFAHLVLIIGVVLVGIVGIGYLVLKNNQIKITDNTTSTVYRTQEECEQATGKTCDFQNCDYVPEDKTFEEVCGKDFKKGWVPSNNLIYLGISCESDEDCPQPMCIPGEDAGCIPATCSNGKCTQNQISECQIDLDCPPDCLPSMPGECFFYKCESGSCVHDPTANWETHRNEEYGFEFKYPADILIPSECFDGVNLYPADSKMPWSQYCNSPFITLAYSTGELSIEQLDPSNFEVTTEKMTVSGQKATKQTIRKINKETPGQDLTIYVQFKNDYYYIFTLNHQRFENEFNQILSTFKFIETCNFEDTICPEGLRCILTDGLPGSKGVCSDEIPEPEKSCLEIGGNWLQEYSECENVSETDCISMGGTYEECASSCRHVRFTPNMGVCSQQCVQLCNL